MYMIYIDPGHGGWDSGAVGPSGLKEKDYTLKIALRVGELLQNSGATVGYTRTTDVALGADVSTDLSNRARAANTAHAKYFLSIHINSAANSAAGGTETYAYGTGGDGEKLARAVQNHLVKEIGLVDRGFKTANFAVLRETTMPAALTEVCFISNPAEERLLKDSTFLEKAAVGIAKGVCEVIGIIWKEEVKMEYFVLSKAGQDERAAAYLSDYLGCGRGVVGMVKSDTIQAAKKIYVIGTNDAVTGAEYVVGLDRYDTCQKVLDLIKGGVK